MSKFRAAALLALAAATWTGSAAAAPPDGLAQARAEIWSKEQRIYSGRSAGDIAGYVDNTAKGYLAWPPFNEVPKGVEGLRATGRSLAGKTHEQLAMTLLDFTLNGTTAIIYYKTHRTRLADGTAVDQTYEVTHTWVRENGQWKVLGGMARERPARPAT